MTEFGNTVQMVDNLTSKSSCCIDTVSGDEIKNIIEIDIGRSRDGQIFRRNRASPREAISAFIASAPGDL
ncbi:MAG TPA: hypothetical protein VK634_20075 [Reyranella sp.]|nr:hypothetical protein [Reyranella sp.]